MRSIKQAAAFKRDLKRESKGKYRLVLKGEFEDIVVTLALDKPLAAKYRDHALIGNWAGCGECHVRGDLLLVYLKTDDNVLHLLRLGSHSELLDM